MVSLLLLGVFGLLVKYLFESKPLLVFLVLVPCGGILIVFKLWCFLFISLLEIVTEFRVLTEELEGVCELGLRIGKLCVVVVTSGHASEVNSRAQRLPDVFVELSISPLSLTSRKLVRSDHKDCIFVTLLEVLVQSRAHRGTFAFEE